MSLLADYLRRRREDGETTTAAPTERATEKRVTTKRVGLAVAVAVLGAAAVRRLRRPDRRRRSDD